MMLTDSPELAHLPENQASSAESLSAPSQSKMVRLKWIPISETVQMGASSRVVHLFLHGPNNWMNIMLVRQLLVEYPFAAGFCQTCKAWRALAVSLTNCKNPSGKLVLVFRGLENEKCATLSQTAARKNEHLAKAEALRNASLGKLTTADKELIKSYKVVELESSSAKKRPPNNSPAEMYRILGYSAERLKQRIEMEAQREFHKGNRKNRQLELKAEHAQQQQVIEFQKLVHAKQEQAIEL